MGERDPESGSHRDMDEDRLGHKDERRAVMDGVDRRLPGKDGLVFGPDRGVLERGAEIETDEMDKMDGEAPGMDEKVGEVDAKHKRMLVTHVKDRERSDDHEEGVEEGSQDETENGLCERWHEAIGQGHVWSGEAALGHLWYGERYSENVLWHA